MVVAIYLPDDIANRFKDDRLQDSLHRLRKLSETFNRFGEHITANDVKLMRQLEASFCLAREVVKKDEILIDPNDPTRGGKQ